jgi:zeaxanthin glucosyltransferase
MKIGFIGLPNPGHLNPMSALARQLQSRNHDVVMFSPPVGESIARAAALPFVPFAEREFSPDKLGEIVGTVSRLKGEEGLQFTVNPVSALNEVKWSTLPNLLSSTGIDAVVVDNYDFLRRAAGFSGQHSGQKSCISGSSTSAWRMVYSRQLEYG